MRVFPFSFPPIMGGAQGGVSPTPTPEPADPYDLTNATLQMVIGGSWTDLSGKAAVSIVTVLLDGIVITDNSQVSSVKLEVSTMDWTAGGSPTTISKKALTVNKDTLTISVITMAVSENSSDIGKTAGVSGDATLYVYDADGNVLQTGTITME